MKLPYGKVKKIKIFLFFLLYQFYSTSAQAVINCGYSDAYINKYTYDQTIPIQNTSYYGGVDGITPGETLGASWQTEYKALLTQCEDNVLNGKLILPTLPLRWISGNRSYQVFDIGIKGIGIAVGSSYIGTGGGPVWVGLDKNFSSLSAGLPIDSSIDQYTTFQATLVATEALSSGTYFVPSRKIGELEMGFSGLGIGIDPFFTTKSINISAFTLTITAGSCAVTSANNGNLNLPDIVMAQLSSTTPSMEESNVLPITLDCPSGVTPFATISDVQNTGNTGKNLTLTAASSAKGVAFRLFRGPTSSPTTEVSFGPPSATKGTINQFQVANKGTSRFYPALYLKAKYIKTGEVSPGDASANASVTFSYQ